MKFKFNLDGIGIATSLACAVHCALLPLLFTSLPLLGINIIHNQYVEFGMIVLAIAIGYISLYNAHKSHHNSLTPLFIFSFGALCLVLKEFLHQSVLFYLLLVLAIICIVTAHIINYLYCRNAKRCHTH